jgi:hypothetical protein
MDGHHPGDREGPGAQNPAYDRLTVTSPSDHGSGSAAYRNAPWLRRSVTAL